MKKVLLTLGVLALVSCSGDDNDTAQSCNCIKRTYALRFVTDPNTGLSTSQSVVIRTEFDQCGVDGQRGAGYVEGSNYVMTCVK